MDKMSVKKMELPPPTCYMKSLVTPQVEGLYFLYVSHNAIKLKLDVCCIFFFFGNTHQYIPFLVTQRARIFHPPIGNDQAFQ